jgi:hypothetical protein
MTDFRDLTPEKLLAFNEVSKGIAKDLIASIMAFNLAFDYDPTELKAFQDLQELNNFILEETFNEYQRKTAVNKFKTDSEK